MNSRIVERTRSAFGVGRPANRSFRQPFSSLDTPLNSDLCSSAFPCRSRPDIIPRTGTRSGIVFERVEPNAVLVRKRRPWIRADTREDPVRIAEPVAERVKMMDAHDARCDPSLAFLPWHPVRNCTHVDGGQDRFTQRSTLKQVVTCADGMVIPHVLIDAECDSRPLTELDNLQCFCVITPQRLLSKNPLE